MNQHTSPLDYELEEFYTGFKKSMSNFYKTHTFKRPLDQWSIQLNLLQKTKNYKEIHQLIIKIMSLYAIDLMRSANPYNANILESNIKRFNNISATLEGMDSINYNNNGVFLLFDIFTTLIKTQPKEDIRELFDQVELYLIYEDYTNLIKYAVDNNKMSVLDKLFKYSNEILLQAMNMFHIVLDDIKLSNNSVISGKKFVELTERDR